MPYQTHNRAFYQRVFINFQLIPIMNHYRGSSILEQIEMLQFKGMARSGGSHWERRLQLLIWNTDLFILFNISKRKKLACFLLACKEGHFSLCNTLKILSQQCLLQGWFKTNLVARCCIISSLCTNLCWYRSQIGKQQSSVGKINYVQGHSFRLLEQCQRFLFKNLKR